MLSEPVLSVPSYPLWRICSLAAALGGACTSAEPSAPTTQQATAEDTSDTKTAEPVIEHTVPAESASVPPVAAVQRNAPEARTPAEPTLRRRWSRVATSAHAVAAARHGLVFDAQTDGADIELRIVNRTRDRRWWCGPERLLEWIELVGVGEEGEVVSADWKDGPEDVPTDGYTWSIGAGDTLWIGTVDVEMREGGIHATLDDGRSLDLGIDDAVRVALKIPTSTAAAHGDCLRRAQTRWYAASEFRAELPWGVPGAPLDQVFPSTVEAIGEIGAIELKVPTFEFRFREKGMEGTMR